MKSNKIRIILLNILCICLLASCAGGQNKKNDNGETKLTWWCKNYANAYLDNYDNIAVFKMMQEKSGVDVEFIHPIIGQESEQFNVLVASGDYPDIVDYNWNAYQGGILKAVSDGIILPLDEYINNEKMPNFMKILDKDPSYKKAIKNSDGTVSVFPSIAESTKINAFFGPTIRKDWLDKLGLEVPETIDEWYNVLTAFKTKDPNGNGIQDEIPFVDDSNATFRYFATAFDSAMAFQNLDGKIVFAPSRSEYKDFLMEMKKWYDEGLIDKDYAAQNRKNVDYKMTSDISGAYIGFTGSQMGNYISTKKGTDYKIVPAPWPNGKDGKNYCGYDGMLNLTTSGNGAAITVKNKNIDKTVEMFDWLYSEEGIIARNYGVEGESYTKSDNGYEYTDKIMNSPEGKDPVEAIAPYTIPIWGTAGCYMLNDSYDKISRSYQEQKDAARIWADSDMSRIVPSLAFSSEEAEVIGDCLADIITATFEFSTKVIMGTESIDNYDSFIANINNMGVDKVVDAYQSAYDRYIK